MKAIFLLLCLVLTACSSLPPAIENPPAFDLAYRYAAQDTARYKTMLVRWGGVIAEVDNEQNASLVQVLLYPLNSYGRPMVDEQPQGRFVIKSSQFLDPLVYSQNSEITVAGTLTGSINRTIGKKTMSLPLVLSNTLYLWPMITYSDYYGYGYPYGGFGYGGYGSGGFGYGGGFGYYNNPYYYGVPRYGWRGGYHPRW
ncbi:MAG: Slp family lipoprotein [Methylococcales bacterium]|nr:Slp family lipoprotein [Methylococcales bacterium]